MLVLVSAAATGCCFVAHGLNPKLYAYEGNILSLNCIFLDTLFCIYSDNLFFK